MKLFNSFSLNNKTLVLLLLSGIPSTTTAFLRNNYDASTSAELEASYPALTNTGDRDGNPKILCPFLRMLERSGRLDDYDQNNIPANALKTAAEDFGCDNLTACGPVIDVVSLGQCQTGSGFFSSVSCWNLFRSSTVDLERLWDAPPISHGCGFTFDDPTTEMNNNEVSTARLTSTLEKLAAAASNNNGQLVYQDLLDTKEDTCASEAVEPTAAGLVETKLIFAYLGGIERGYIEYTDVERFLQVSSQLPETKAQKEISALYLAQVS